MKLVEELIIERWKNNLAMADGFPKSVLVQEISTQLAQFDSAQADLDRLRGEIEEAQARSDMHQSQAAACRELLDSMAR